MASQCLGDDGMNLTDTVLLGLLQVLGELWPLDSTGQIALIFPVDAVPTAAKLVVLIATQIGVLLALLIILHRGWSLQQNAQGRHLPFLR